MVKRNKFADNIERARKVYTQALKPRACYTSKFDIFSLNWGRRKVEHTIELNLFGKGDLRFDISEEGDIVGIEVENFSEVLKKVDCDKAEGIHVIK